MPIAKERIGGTHGVVEKREDARRIVPSPPNVTTRSGLEWMGLVPDEGSCCRGEEKMGWGRSLWRVEARAGSVIRDIEG